MGLRAGFVMWRWLVRRPLLLGLIGTVLLGGQGVYLLLVPTRTAAGTAPAASISESFGLTPQQAARGRDLLVRNNCLVCHRVGDTGGTMGLDLTNYAEREIRADDVMVFLKDPGSWYPSARMPAYSDLDPKDLALIANYLCGLMDPARLRQLPPGADLSRGVCGPRFVSLGSTSPGVEKLR